MTELKMPPAPPPRLETLMPGLRRFIRARVRDPVIAEDLLQETCVRVLTRMDQLQHPSRMAGWVFRIAHHVVVDHFRRKRPEDPLPRWMEGGDGAPETPETPESVLAAWLGEAILELPEPYRAALQLTELQGASQKASAKELGVSYSAFKSRVQRGRAMLRDAVVRCCHVELDAVGRVLDFTQRQTGTSRLGACGKPSCC